LKQLQKLFQKWQGRRIKGGRYDEECKEITAKKNSASKELIQRHTRNTVEKYKELRRTEKRVHKDTKKWYYKNQLMKIEELNQLKESRKFYKLIYRLRKEFGLVTDLNRAFPDDTEYIKLVTDLNRALPDDTEYIKLVTDLNRALPDDTEYIKLVTDLNRALPDDTEYIKPVTDLNRALPDDTEYIKLLTDFVLCKLFLAKFETSCVKSSKIQTFQSLEI
jgi:hypothetical protein